jgi:protein involved in polysaccharide export with SLBB domain
VDVAKPETTNVLVTGAVTSPGLVPLRRTERNLLFAIVGAGGVSDMASGQVSLKKIRCPNEILTLDLSKADDLKKAIALPPLENGDIINVKPSTPNTIFVGGLVNMPHAQAYPPGVEVTVLQALAASGGLRTDLTPREATIIRRMPDGHDVQVKLNLDRVTTGKDPNLTLAAGDILWVPYTAETRVQEWINQNIYIRGGASFSYSQTGDHNYLHGQNWNNNGGTNLNNNLQNQYDPFGFLNQNSALNNLVNRPVTATAKKQ